MQAKYLPLDCDRRGQLQPSVPSRLCHSRAVRDNAFGKQVFNTAKKCLT